MSMNEMESKIRELRSLQRLIEEAQAEAEAIKDGIKDGIKAQLTAQGVDELHAGEYRVTWKAVTSSRLDGKALTAALPVVAERVTTTSTTRRFCVA